MSELKPCPFCGGEDMMIKKNAVGHIHWVCCKVCETEGAPRDYDSGAITAWNTRTDNRTDLEKLKAVMDGIGVEYDEVYINSEKFIEPILDEPWEIYWVFNKDGMREKGK